MVTTALIPTEKDNKISFDQRKREVILDMFEILQQLWMGNEMLKEIQVNETKRNFCVNINKNMNTAHHIILTDQVNGALTTSFWNLREPYIHL